MFRPTWDPRGSPFVFAYRTFTFYGAAFQKLPLTSGVPLSGSRNPPLQAAGFGLFRFRSPLLTESHLDFGSSGY